MSEIILEHHALQNVQMYAYVNNLANTNSTRTFELGSCFLEQSLGQEADCYHSLWHSSCTNSQTNQYGNGNLRILCRLLSHTHCESSHSAAPSSQELTRKGLCLGPDRLPPHSQMVQARRHWILGRMETGSCRESESRKN